ncbi:MAG: hypothetical protein KR126chlam1_01000 [Chlamydiae bacterium]|nr:hypothetical protein [Chlamydiota bacterium]
MKGIFSILALLVFSTVFADYHSQCGQDRFVYETYFEGHRDGVFVDIGAHDGISLSNTYFFEKELGWTGVCIEPIPEVFARLEKNRDVICVKGCISDKEGISLFHNFTGYPEMLSGLVDKFDPRHLQRAVSEMQQHNAAYSTIEVECFLLNNILDQYGINHIQFLSLDTEGGEFDILNSIDFSRVQIDVATVEDNYNDTRFIPFMESKGFKLVKTFGDVRNGQELIFAHRDFLGK